jgi:Tfp pilus assembly protein PilV
MWYLRQQKGFLLLEVVIAIIIISTALLGTAGLLRQAALAVTDSSEESAALFLAQKRLERLKKQDAAFWQVNCPSRNIPFPDEPSPVILNGCSYTIRTVADKFPIIGMKRTVVLAKITVSVSWAGKNAKGTATSRQIQIASLYAETP